MQIKSLLNTFDENFKDVAKKSFYSTLIKIIGMLIGIIISISLGRNLGPEGLGVIDLTSKIINIVLVFIMIGMPNVIIKEISISLHAKNFKVIKNVMYTSYIALGSVSLVISIGIVVFSKWISYNIFNEPRLAIPLIFASIAMNFQVFSRIFASALIGYGKIWQSSLVNETLSVFVVGLILFICLTLNKDINIVKVSIIYAISRLVVFIIISRYWSVFSPKVKKFEIIISKLIKTSMPLLLISATAVISSSISSIILGIFGNSAEVGLYSVALRLALTTGILLQVVNAAVSPKFAVLYSSNELLKLKKLLQSITSSLILIGITIFSVFLFFGKIILSFWGISFIDAYNLLIIISLGQLISVSTGSVGILLIMSGHEKIQRNISLSFMPITIIINFVFIYIWGSIGAAIATAMALSSENILKVIYVKKIFGFYPLRIPIILRK